MPSMAEVRSRVWTVAPTCEGPALFPEDPAQALRPRRRRCAQRNSQRPQPWGRGKSSQFLSEQTASAPSTSTGPRTRALACGGVTVTARATDTTPGLSLALATPLPRALIRDTPSPGNSWGEDRLSCRRWWPHVRAGTAPPPRASACPEAPSLAGRCACLPSVEERRAREGGQPRTPSCPPCWDCLALAQALRPGLDPEAELASRHRCGQHRASRLSCLQRRAGAQASTQRGEISRLSSARLGLHHEARCPVHTQIPGVTGSLDLMV